MSKKYVFNFDEGGISDYALLGLKGANLAQINRLNLPIPFGFTISTDGCKYYLRNHCILPTDFIEQILRGLKAIENESGLVYGDSGNPLLLSIRTGASVPCKGLARTLINVGMNDAITSGLVRINHKNPTFAWECYSRFIRDYGVIVTKLDEKLFKDAEFSIRKENSGLPEPDILQKIISQYKKIYRKGAKRAFPQDVAEQLFESIRACLESWNSNMAQDYRRSNNIDDSLGCAVSVQQMAFGNYDINSGVGVAYTRNPITGEKAVTGEMLRKAQEKSKLSSTYTYDMEELKKANPALYMKLENACAQIENFYQDMQALEFCVQSGNLYIMQVESATRSPSASVKIAVDLAKERVLTKQQALLKVDAEGVKALMQPEFDKSREVASRVLAEGVCAYPGCASGVIALSSTMALQYASLGEKVILVQETLNPKDAEGIAVASGIITLKGGYNSYASVVARNKCIPCIIECKRLTFNEVTHAVKLGGLNYKEGDKISIDALKAKVYGEALPLKEPTIDGDLELVLEWAKAKQPITIYTDADTPQKVARGIELGATGIGLVRTENMFYEADRLLALRKFFLAPDEKTKSSALKSIFKYQIADFTQLFEQSRDRDINIRLIDATLNELLPATQNDLRGLAREMGAKYEDIKTIYNDLKQTNPILGIRGCRMLVMHPELAKTQVTAIFNALLDVRRRLKVTPKLKITVPMVSILPEFEILERLIRETAQTALSRTKFEVEYEIGCMLETPRSCMIADKIAEKADFVCFGTNDLTQLTFGFSSDDCMKFLNEYYDDNLIYADPFKTLDKKGVHELISLALDKIRSVKAKMPVFMLGDIVADTDSLKQALDLKINKISCVPNKIPSAIIAQAQAVIKQVSE